VLFKTQTTKRKVIFPAAYIKVVTESGDIVEYYSENSHFDQKRYYFKVNIKLQKEGHSMVPLYKIKDHDFISFKI
jgi:hypothetical protein